MSDEVLEVDEVPEVTVPGTGGLTDEEFFEKWRVVINRNRKVLRSLTDKFAWHIRELEAAKQRIQELEKQRAFPEYPDRKGEKFDKLKIDLYHKWGEAIAADPAALIELIDILVDEHYACAQAQHRFDRVPFEAIARQVEAFYPDAATAATGSASWNEIDAWVREERARRLESNGKS